MIGGKRLEMDWVERLGLLIELDWRINAIYVNMCIMSMRNIL